MNLKLKAAVGAVAVLLGTQAMAQITFYEREGFRGRAFTAERRIGDLERFGFNDRASSVVIDRGRWEVCDEPRFEGHCVVLRRGSYDTLRGLGMQNAISSVRPIERDRDRQAAINEMPAPLPAPSPEYRRRPNERIFQVPVTSARAVVGPPDQRCWVERQQVGQAGAPGQTNVGGALLGGLIGGVLGHQVGGGSGKDLATMGGAVAGAVVGNNVARNGSPVPSAQDVQRCENVQNPTPAYWDVTYNYRGQEHHVQTTTPPGNTIAINERGEPRM